MISACAKRAQGSLINSGPFALAAIGFELTVGDWFCGELSFSGKLEVFSSHLPKARSHSLGGAEALLSIGERNLLIALRISSRFFASGALHRYCSSSSAARPRSPFFS